MLMLSEQTEDSGAQSAYSAARLLAMLDKHGPKAMVYIIAAQLLGVFSWMQDNAPGVCG
jgi:peptidoglycan/xylan/chitin deacetylase (PgdA/CDA1 family)